MAPVHVPRDLRASLEARFMTWSISRYAEYSPLRYVTCEGSGDASRCRKQRSQAHELLRVPPTLNSLETGAMTANVSRIGALVVRIQNEFLTSPSLRLTLPEAAQRFGIDHPSCTALLDFLVDGKVLTRTGDGVYLRRFPGRTSAVAHAA